jgi:glycosyltransferase involved in cell wall biosynthesis
MKSNTKSMKIVAIIPAYNEEETVASVIKDTLPYVNEVIVINDGSTDDTKEIAESAGADVIDNIVNRGLGKTIKRGYEEALKRDADVIVQLDADGQYLAKEIPLLVQPVLNNETDLVLGSRLENIRYNMPILKRFGNNAFSFVLRILTGADVKDGQTGFRAVRRQVLEMAMPANKYTYTQEMIIKTTKEGWRIKSVPITFVERVSGESRLMTNPLSYAWRSWAIIIRTLRDYHPLSFFGTAGVLFILSGVILGTALAYKFAVTGWIGRTPSLILTALLIMAGVQLLFMGLMADMIRK